MTADAVTVTPATPLKRVVDLLINQKVSAVPVLSLQGKILGLVAETDLLRKEELQRDPDGRHGTHLNYRARRDLATAETAGEIMSTAPVTVRPGATVAEAARLMDRHDVTCLPVTDETGKLLGVVGPRNLLRVFLRPDDEIQPEIVKDVLVGYLGTNPALVQVEVTDGVVRPASSSARPSAARVIQVSGHSLTGPSALPAALAARWHGKRREGPRNERRRVNGPGRRHGLLAARRPAHRAIGIREKPDGVLPAAAIAEQAEKGGTDEHSATQGPQDHLPGPGGLV